MTKLFVKLSGGLRTNSRKNGPFSSYNMEKVTRSNMKCHPIVAQNSDLSTSKLYYLNSEAKFLIHTYILGILVELVRAIALTKHTAYLSCFRCNVSKFEI